MKGYLEEVKTLFHSCSCGNHHHPIPVERICIEKGALSKAADFIEEKKFHHCVIIADEKTFAAAGETLSVTLTNAGIEAVICVIHPDENGDVLADERSIVQALLAVPLDTDVLLAVGAGTIHDIVRFCSAKMNIPFISIPTAPSVDGFTSLGAPLIVRGQKKTFQMASPISVFADMDILLKAPMKLLAAGSGDVMAKYTSLADWRFGHLAAGEPFCPTVANMTRSSLDSVTASIEKIAQRDEAGVRLLMEALIQSGLAMLIFGQSHPASGGEHHLSHFWEIEFIKLKRPAVLHGAKVGVTTAMISDLYRNQFLEALKNLGGMGQYLGNNEKSVKNVLENLEEIRSLYSALPEGDKIRSWLEALGGECFPEQLGIEQSLVEKSLAEAHQLRNRFTALKFLNEVVLS